MTLLEASTWWLSIGLLVAAMAAVGYVVGRRRLHLKNYFDSRSELTRALEVADELESIAVRLRHALAAHRPAVARFLRKVSRFEGNSGVSWHELCDHADELLKPTMRLGTEISHGYAEILRQMSHLSSFADLRNDPLTGIHNRRAFDESLDSALAAQARYPAPLSLAILDVDRFKQVNDQHGHLHGDRVLQELAQELKNSVRDCDMVARFGGEEFVVLMPRTELHAACQLAERLRATIAAKLPVTVSLGVAAWLPGESAIALLARADAALYAAKEGGRNCVHLHEGMSGRTVGIRTSAVKKPQTASAPAEGVVGFSLPAIPLTSETLGDACVTPLG